MRKLAKTATPSSFVVAVTPSITGLQRRPVRYCKIDGVEFELSQVVRKGERAKKGDINEKMKNERNTFVKEQMMTGC